MSSVSSKRKYSGHGAEKLPSAIFSDQEYHRILKTINVLMKRHLTLSPQEGKLLRKLAQLVEKYQEIRFPELHEPVPPLDMLKFNMENHGHTAKDLWDVIGDKGTVSKILSGKRAISKAQAKRLGEFYAISPALFI